MGLDDGERPRHSGRVSIARSPEHVYTLVSDVTRMGDWSPVCTACWWDDSDGSPAPGAWFTGRNETPDRVWETRCEVVAATPGREFTFIVGGSTDGLVRWSSTLEPTGDGTELTESWEILPTLLARYGEHSDDGGKALVAEHVQITRRHRRHARRNERAAESSTDGDGRPA